MWNFTICKNNCSNYLESFFNSMNEGFAIHEIICDGSGKPVDYKFLEVNEAFLNITGLKKENIIDKRVTEVYPNIEPQWVLWQGCFNRRTHEYENTGYQAYINNADFY